MAFPRNDLVGTLLEFYFMRRWDEISIKFIKICCTKKPSSSQIQKIFKVHQLPPECTSREEKNPQQPKNLLDYFIEGKRE